MSEQSLKLVQFIRNRLHDAMKRITLANLSAGILLTVGISLTILLIVVGIEAGFWLAPGPRSILFWLLVVVTLGLLGYFVVVPLLRHFGLLPGLDEESVASKIGETNPVVADRLVNLLDLADGKHSDAPDALVDEAVRMLGTQIRDVPFEQVENFGRARQIGKIALLPVLGLVVFLVSAPSTFLGASARVFSPGEYFNRPAPFELIVSPGSTEVVRGESVEIKIRTRGEQEPEKIVLSTNHLDEEKVDQIELVRDSTGVFTHTLVNIRRSLRYRAEAGNVETPWYEAKVSERPLVRSLQVTLDYPDYTAFPSRRLEPNIGNVSAHPGTRVHVEVGVGGRDVEEAYLAFDDGATEPLSISGATATGSFTLRRPGTYQVILKDSRNVQNEDPITYNLTLLADAPPSIVLVEPDASSMLDERMFIGTRTRITDDFGFSRLQLHYRLSESRFEQPMDSFESITIPIADPRNLDQEVLYSWLLTETTDLDPVPGDVIEYYFEVWDNDSFSGFKSARSAVHTLRLPSLSEQYEQLASEHENAEYLIEELIQESQQVREDFQELRDELRRKQEGDWEDQRQLEQIQRRQSAIESRVEELTEQIESITATMQEHDMVSEETLEAYRELQRVAAEINSPELQEALRKLQEAMQNLDLNQLQESLGQFEFNEDLYRKRLERTLELFEKLRMQQGLDEAAKRAEELAKQQQRLAEETGKLMEELEKGKNPEATPENRPESENEPSTGEQQERNGSDENDSTPRNEDLAREQERSAEEMRQLMQKLEELREQAEKIQRSPKNQLEQLKNEAQRQRLPERMQQNSEQLRQNQLQDAQQGQQQMEQMLQQMQQSLQNMQQQMQAAGLQVNMAGLRRALDNILTLSQQQEGLRARVQNLSPDNPQMRQHAQRQVELSEGLTTVSDSLQKLARDIPQMSSRVQRETGEALRDMSMATEAMAERIAGQAAGHQKGAMMHLNELALLLSDLMNQMMNGASGSGGMSLQQMIEQMQQMAGDQQKLNEQIQQLLNDIQGDRLTTNVEERLRQMSEQQEAIRRQLKELSRNPEARGKLLGDLDKIAEQMEETIRELRNAGANRQTIERQQQILTRLLDAQRSLRERGEEDRREGRAGSDFERTSPGALTPEEKVEKLRRDLLRALENGYAPDYENLIKRYFDLLQEQSGSNSQP